MITLDFEAARQLNECIDVFTEVEPTFRTGVDNTRGVFREVGSDKLVRAVDALADTVPTLFATVNETLEALRDMKSIYEKAQEALN